MGGERDKTPRPVAHHEEVFSPPLITLSIVSIALWKAYTAVQYHSFASAPHSFFAPQPSSHHSLDSVPHIRATRHTLTNLAIHRCDEIRSVTLHFTNPTSI